MARNGFRNLLAKNRIAVCLPVVGLLIGCSEKQGAPEAQRSQAVAPDSAPQGTSSSAPLESQPVLPELASESPSLPDLPGAAKITTGPVRSAEVDAAFEQLFSPELEPGDWDKKLQKIVDAGVEAMPTLRAELKSSDVARREQASTVLVLMGASAEAAVPELIGALKDSSSFVRANAAAALASFPGELAKARDVLIELLDSPEPELRRLAASNLTFLGESASDLVPRLALALEDTDAEVVRPIAQLLGQIGPAASEALPRLQKIAFEADGDVKAAAEQAVLQIEGKSAPETP
jgi:HEAT repeat protein